MSPPSCLEAARTQRRKRKRRRCLPKLMRCCATPDLAKLFRGNALSEVPVSAALPELGGRRIHGIIDRLIISDDSILAVDFKTNAVVPQTPETCPNGLLRQMGAYQSALSQVFPGKTIRTALLWTNTATLMHLPHDLVMATLCDTSVA